MSKAYEDVDFKMLDEVTMVTGFINYIHYRADPIEFCFLWKEEFITLARTKYSEEEVLSKWQIMLRKLVSNFNTMNDFSMMIRTRKFFSKKKKEMNIVMCFKLSLFTTCDEI